MALANYSDLQTSIASWADRAADTNFTAVVPDFIALLESNLNTEAAIRTQFNRTSTTISTVIGQNYISTPTDFLAVDSLIITKNDQTLGVITPYPGAAALYADYPNATLIKGQPKGFINLASKLELAPTPDIVYTLTLYYYQKIPAISANTTNWLLTNFPNLYLFGSLTMGEAYLGSDPRIKLWGDLYDNALQKLQGAVDRNKYGGSPLSVKADIVV